MRAGYIYSKRVCFAATLSADRTKVSELSTRVAILNNIENILNTPIEKLEVLAEGVRPNSQ